MPWGSQQASLAVVPACHYNPAMVLRTQATAQALALHWREIHLHQYAWGCFSVGICGSGNRDISALSCVPPKVDGDPEL